MVLLALLNVLGIAQGMFLAVALWSRRRGHILANRMLALLVLVCTHIVLIGVLYATRLIAYVPQLIGTQSPLIFLFGPLIYLFFRHYQFPKARLRWWDALHLVPFVAYVVYLLPIYALPPAAKVEGIFNAFIEGGEQVSRAQFWHSVIGLTHIGVYIVQGWRVLSPASPRWLHRFAWGAVALWGVAVGRFIWELFTAATIYGTVLIIPTALALFVCTLAYVTLHQSRAFVMTPRYERSAVEPIVAQTIREQLLQTMEEDRPYLQPGLTLDDLATCLGVTSHVLSQVLNTELGERFNDFVNGYRVTAAQRMLRDPTCDHLSVDAIAMDAGFGSRSTFYKAFRKQTGCTPMEYAREGVVSP